MDAQTIVEVWPVLTGVFTVGLSIGGAWMIVKNNSEKLKELKKDTANEFLKLRNEIALTADDLKVHKRVIELNLEEKLKDMKEKTREIDHEVDLFMNNSCKARQRSCMDGINRTTNRLDSEIVGLRSQFSKIMELLVTINGKV